MAYDKENRRLYTDTVNGKGISLDEIADCIRDYRFGKIGSTMKGRDLGMLCTSPKITSKCLWRPYEIDTPIFDKDAFKNGTLGAATTNIYKLTYGYRIPRDYYIANLWKRAWEDIGRPSTYFSINMFENYCQKAEDYGFSMKVTYPTSMVWEDITKPGKVIKGSKLNIQYISDNSIDYSVNPALIDTIKDYYISFQIYKANDDESLGSLIYSYCTGVKANYSGKFNGSSGNTIQLSIGNQLLYGGNKYYVVPFLSPYTFSTVIGGDFSLSGYKYSLIFEPFKIDDYTIEVDASLEPYIYDIALSLSYGNIITVTVTYTATEVANIAPKYKYSVYRAGSIIYTSDEKYFVEPDSETLLDHIIVVKGTNTITDTFTISSQMISNGLSSGDTVRVTVWDDYNTDYRYESYEEYTKIV
ncbi:MAG: hypothetical protein ACI4N3_04110 [Alphaproteobacteria bacterium]